MRDVISLTRFRKDFKLALRRGKKEEKLLAVIDQLRADVPLAPKHKPHKLTGNWTGHMECHIEPDWLLIYKIDDCVLELVRTGTHTDLFD